MRRRRADLHRLTGEQRAFDRLVGDLSPADLQRPSACPGRSIGEVVAHVTGGAAPLPWWVGPGVRAVDVAVHSLDVAIPTGRTVRFEPDRMRWLLDTASRIGRPLGVRMRIAGLWLEAVDVGWTHGTLPEGTARDRRVRDVTVSGPGPALLLAMVARVIWLDRLAGHGVEVLGARA